MEKIKKFFRDEEGVTMIEYGLIAALIAVGVIAALTTLRGSLQNVFTNVSSNVSGS